MKKPFNIITLIDRRLALIADISKIYKSSKIYKRIAGLMLLKTGSSKLKQIDIVMNNLLTFSPVQRTILIISFLIINVLSVNAQDNLQVKGDVVPGAKKAAGNVSMSADTFKIRGIVVSGANKPVANVSISIEGSFDLSVLTDKNGKFEIESTSNDNWLIVAPSSGYKYKKVFLNRRDEIKIYLTSNDLVSGDDKISILAQDRLRKDIISAFSDLDISTIKQTPSLSVDQHMQGRIPGMHVVNRSGDAGSGAVNLLRGTNSLNTNNQPLYIVDGIILTPQSLFGSNLDGYEYNPLLSVNPLDISRTTVVKDPTITATYGSKASNGLVIIETLDPSATKTSIEVDLRSGYSLAPSNQIPQLNAGQHKTLINEVLFSSGKVAEDIRLEYPNLFLTPEDERYIDYQHNTDWQKLIFENSSLYNINVKVKGGDEIARYGLSLGYISSKGIIKTTGYDGYNLRFVSMLDIFEWLKMNAGVSLNYSTSDLKESAIVKETSPILTSLAKSPLLNPYGYDIEGEMLTALAPVDELGVSNPMAVINNYEAGNINYHFVSNLGFEVTLNKNLFLKSNFGLTYNVLKEKLFMPNVGMEHYYNEEARNVTKVSNNDFNSINNTTYLKYSKNFGKNHKLYSTTGVNILNNVFEYDWGLTKNSHANDQYRMLQDGTNNLRELGGQNRIWNWISFYENVTYSFQDKYLATASVSLDGSSRIGDNATNTLKLGKIPFGIFYAGGLAWRLSSESFLNEISWLEELKLRATYGKTGNDDIGESNASNYYKSIKFRETVGLYPATIPNDKLTYETVSQLNLGVDLALMGDRIKASFDIFNSTTDNMLIYSPIKSYLGYNFRPENGGKLKNTGWEFNTSLRLIDGKSFKWDILANLSTSTNEILEITGDKYIIDIEGAQLVNMVGKPANSFYGYIFEGVYSKEDDVVKGLINDRDLSYHAGDAKFKDISGPAGTPDGVINGYDKTIIGSASPKYYGGISNSFTYKRWTLSAFLQFVTGNEVFNYIRFKNEQMSGLQNQSASVLNRWQKEGQQTDIPRALWKDPMGNSSFSTRWIEDGSFMRIKNVTLSYKIPGEFLAFQNAEFYVSANNIFTLTKYLGYDPEFAYSYSQIGQGVDYGLTPQPRQFIIGIRLGL